MDHSSILLVILPGLFGLSATKVITLWLKQPACVFSAKAGDSLTDVQWSLYLQDHELGVESLEK